MTRAAMRQVVCEQGSELYVIDGSLQVANMAGTLRVTMSENGNQLSQETLSPTTTTFTCGCGDITSTIRTFHIQLPPPSRSRAPSGAVLRARRGVSP